MRVLYLTNNPILGGTSRPLTCWLQAGPAHGVRGVVAARHAGALTRWLESARVPFRVDPMPWPSRWWPFAALRHALGLARWARRGGVDLIDCNEHDLYPFALLLRRLLRRPLVCRVQYRVDRDFCRWAFAGGRCPDGLVWTTRAQRLDSAGAVEGLVPARRQWTVPLGLDAGAFGRWADGRAATRRGWGLPEDAVILGTASALRPVKRVEEFVELVRRVAGADPRVCGVLAGDAVGGDEAYKERVLRLVEGSGLGPRLRWLGWLEPVEPFLHAIDLFVSTSEYESFGMSVCEAMACGRPVAGYSAVAVQEVVGDAGVLAPTGDLGALTRAVLQLVGRPERMAELGRRARRRAAECFDVGVGLRQLIAVYQEVLHAWRAGPDPGDEEPGCCR